MTVNALLQELELRYPNDALLLRGKPHEEVRDYLVRLELIEEIRRLVEEG